LSHVVERDGKVVQITDYFILGEGARLFVENCQVFAHHANATKALAALVCVGAHEEAPMIRVVRAARHMPVA